MGKQETDPLPRFRSWFEEAQASEPNDPSAMTLATADSRGRPSARMVLLKGVDDGGFVFYTNLESRKARELAENAQAALLFHWKSLRRQVRIEGPVTNVSDAEADEYFATRPRGSRIGAWASDQSRPMEGMLVLEKRVAEFTAKFGLGEIPRPPHWSGFRITPDRIEFWKEGRFRLHERIVHIRRGDSWATERLFP
ncbi:MAG: pyridoxamine 5'-phosphate oxidase [Alphaproteobacteria bacterium]|nr:pyridoxamine 5'-phosphate oxidase [Alphaproteobacteria bacterium]